MSLKQKILKLRKQGYSYNKIVDELDCAKSTVSYHLGEGQRNKTVQRQRKYRKENPLNTKRVRFLQKTDKAVSNTSTSNNTNLKEILNRKLQKFSRNYKNEGTNYMFSYKELKEHIGDDPKCYLTGKKIDLYDASSYSLDHIIPRSKGGDNSLKNCGLATREANQAKSDQNLEDFINFCQAVVNNLKK